jgi:hypothetical protein
MPTLSATSRPHAPWFIIPADHKWYARLAIASTIYQHFETLKLSYPEASKELQQELQVAKEMLEKEPPPNQLKKRNNYRSFACPPEK